MRPASILAVVLVVLAFSPGAQAALREAEIVPLEAGCPRTGFCWSVTNLTVDLGDEVVLRFSNPASNAAPHSLRVQGGVDRGTPVRLPGESRSTDLVAFNATAAGVIPFVCEVHSGMRGVVYVKPAPLADKDAGPRPLIPGPGLALALAGVALAALGVAGARR